jgi:hypothetical protein
LILIPAGQSDIPGKSCFISFLFGLKRAAGESFSSKSGQQLQYSDKVVNMFIAPGAKSNTLL